MSQYSKFDNPPPSYEASTSPPPSAPSTIQCTAIIEPDQIAGKYQKSIKCQVCQSIVSLEGKKNVNVVKCHQCNETTPIRVAPLGKKYVRCPCNCLLICKSTSTRVSCPRTNCNRVIDVITPGTVIYGLTSSKRAGSSVIRLICAHCGLNFIVSAFVQSSAARCPHCRQVSSIGSQYKTMKVMIYLVAGLIFLGLGLALTLSTLEMAQSRGYYYGFYASLFFCSVANLLRGIFYAFMPVSNIVAPNVNQIIIQT